MSNNRLVNQLQEKELEINRKIGLNLYIIIWWYHFLTQSQAYKYKVPNVYVEDQQHILSSDPPSKQLFNKACVGQYVC